MHAKTTHSDTSASPFPIDPTLESGPALLRDGYRFIDARCRRLGSDVFETRLLLEPTICLQGAEAAAMFYGREGERPRLTRKGAVPAPILSLLQDFGSVQTLDGAAHRHRKAMFMSLMIPEAIERMRDLFEEEWRAALPAWRRIGQIALLPAVERVLTRAVCRWAGVPLDEKEVAQRFRELSAMIDGAGSIGLRQLCGQVERQRSEAWLRGLVSALRAGEITAPEDSAFAVIAFHRDAEGLWLPEEIAAVELLNILRPTVAVGRFVVFLALALHLHGDYTTDLQSDDALTRAFVQEVRRLTPFFPFVGGRVDQPFTWRGRDFKKGERLLLDIYGTHRDPRSWSEPQAFWPERFLDWEGDPFSLIPQGGGGFDEDHRCAGEWLTIAVMESALRLLLTETRYRVPEQDLGVDLARIPAQPKSRFVMEMTT